MCDRVGSVVARRRRDVHLFAQRRYDAKLIHTHTFVM
jgi:hypothetical protein